MNRFPDFNKWHKVPKDATIPAGTTYFTTKRGKFLAYIEEGWSTGYPAVDRSFGLDYYTEKPIPSPVDEKIEKRARAMYYAVPGSDTWEYEEEYTQEAWLDLARKYVEKED